MRRSQSDIEAGGHVAGRDVIVTSVAPSLKIDRVLEALYNRYEAEVKAKRDDPDATPDQVAHILDELNSFFVSYDDEPKSLEQKLSGPVFSPLLPQARLFKDRFRRSIEKFLYYPSAQQIYAHLLGEVSSLFHMHIVPLLDGETDLQILMSSVDEKIMTPIQATLPDCEPICNRTMLLGMMYFLTGNCFINWSTC